MSQPFPIITLNNGKEQSSLRFHPWVFSGAIKKKPEDIQEGAVVEVQDSQGNFLALGHFQTGTIAVRIFSFRKTDVDLKFWKNKITRAFNLRKKLGLTDNPTTNVYRLLFAEGDGMPGLIIDYYNGTAVIQTHSFGMHLMKDQLTEVLKEIYGDQLKAVYDKSEETMSKLSSVKYENGYLWGKTESNEVMENSHRFFVDWEKGQKTGFFIDQRESRKLLSKYCKDKVVLNTFCYTGGFSVYALAAGASEVHSVDSSKRAIELTDTNISLNASGTNGIHESFTMDTFDFLKEKEMKYDVIILDPPAFAKHQNVRHNAVMAYKRLNAEALKLIKPGGFLFTYSCSQVVDRQTFRGAIMAAAIESKRNVRILYQLNQPPDHPFSIFHPEGEYLKGIVLYIE